MIYTVIADNNQSYELPAKNLAVMEKLEKIMKIDSEKGLNIRQKYQKLYDFVNDILGADNVAEILNGKTLASIDVGCLEILILKIQDAYNDPVANYRAEKIANSFSQIPTDKIVALTDMSKALK